MQLRSSNPRSCSSSSSSFPHHSSVLAFTLTEMMVSIAIFTLVISGVIYSHMMGVKLYELAKAKLGANDQARGALALLITEIRSAKEVQIGSGTSSSFTEVASGSAQQGSALQIYATTNTNSYVRYYLDTSAKKLFRKRSESSSLETVAEYITNSVLFTSENFQGTILTDNQNNRVIGINLQFYQIQYPVTPIGPGNYYDSYQINTKVTRRALE
ncbi:MAG: hypothetical protein AB1705_18390 [Verrucomicrobiota bacterium]